MRFLLTALGSYGDVLPIVGLASALHERGHEAIVITNPHFQSVVESAGVGYLPLGTEQEYDELARHPDLWHTFWGPVLIMRVGMKGSVRKLYEVIDANFRPGDVLAAHCLDLASRVHQEKFGTAVASVHLSPVMLRSFHQSPQYDGLLMQDWVPRWLRKSQFWLADKIIDRIVAPELNRLRQDLGLNPVHGILRDWFFSPQLVLGLFPSWFAPPQPDWPPNTVTTGFPLWDQSATLEPNEEVEEFLQAGEPPIVFAPGSAMTQGEWFFAAAVDACQRLGRRGILATSYPEQLPRELPPGVRQFDFVPFSRLLPRSAALVHHGGIGTCGQGLAAGIPQLVMPMAFDQRDNAARLKRLGVAEAIRRQKFRGPAVADVLDRLLGCESAQAAATQWAQRCDPAAALSDACAALERLGQ
jgi:UDP:flavonoid glycosyltransferase YjiC (YdhE family)